MRASPASKRSATFSSTDSKSNNQQPPVFQEPDRVQRPPVTQEPNLIPPKPPPPPTPDQLPYWKDDQIVSALTDLIGKTPNDENLYYKRGQYRNDHGRDRGHRRHHRPVAHRVTVGDGRANVLRARIDLSVRNR